MKSKSSTTEEIEARIDHRIETNYLQIIAHKNYVAARVLWNLGLFLPSLQQLQESMEKYLKVLWVRDKTFANFKDYEKALKDFGHNPKAVFDALSETDQNTLMPIIKKNNIILFNLEGLRYGTRMPLVGYSDELFRSAEIFIKKVRAILGENVPRNLFSEIYDSCTSMGFHRTEKKALAVRSILQIKQKGPTKKERKAHWRSFQTMLARWDDNPPVEIRKFFKKFRRPLS